MNPTAPQSDRPAVKTRVLVVDDHAVVRVGIAARLGIEPDLEVCGEAATATEALQQVAALRPDVVLLDLSLSEGNGLDVIKTLRERGHDVKILVVSGHDEALYAERCVRAGAQGYLTKTEAVDTIVDAIRRVRDEAYCLSDAVTARILVSLGTRGRAKCEPLAALSDRELQVYEAIGAGLTVKEIAAKHGLSPKTIDTYRCNMKQKLGLDSSQQLARHAMHWLLRRTLPDAADSPHPESAR